MVITELLEFEVGVPPQCPCIIVQATKRRRQTRPSFAQSGLNLDKAKSKQSKRWRGKKKKQVNAWEEIDWQP